jgi:hypothetical protein
MTAGMTYCSAFQEDAHFGAIIDSFLYRWTAPAYGVPRIASSE